MMVVEAPRAGLRTWAKALRVHQWLKNLLVFVPLLASGRFRDAQLTGDATLAFVSFSLFASAVYLVNDMVDLQSDRLHQTKRNRPFASGALPVAAGVAATPILIMASIGLARGIFDDQVFPSLLLAILVSTLVTPPLVRLVFRGVIPEDSAEPAPATGSS